MKIAVPHLLVLLLLAPPALAISPAEHYINKPAEWYKTDEAKQIAKNILAWQTPEGGWPKNTDTLKPPPTSRTKENLHPTFDNGATTYELRYLARMFNATNDPTYSAAFDKGLDLILQAQYPNGGWPQSYPTPKGYYSHITYNDGAMERLMYLVRDVARDPQFHFVPPDKRQACATAWTKGIDCILKTQIKVDGKPTVWCAQHDEHTLAPAPARAFELASYSGAESVGLVELLMSIDPPTPEIRAAVDGAVAWFKSHEIPHIRVEDRKQPNTPRGFERFVVEDPAAAPMWARFYDLKSEKPLFVDRDSVPKYALKDIGIERRTGYKWLGYWPKDLIEKEYPAWQSKHPESKD